MLIGEAWCMYRLLSAHILAPRDVIRWLPLKCASWHSAAPVLTVSLMLNLRCSDLNSWTLWSGMHFPTRPKCFCHHWKWSDGSGQGRLARIFLLYHVMFCRVQREGLNFLLESALLKTFFMQMDTWCLFWFPEIKKQNVVWVGGAVGLHTHTREKCTIVWAFNCCWTCITSTLTNPAQSCACFFSKSLCQYVIFFFSMLVFCFFFASGCLVDDQSWLGHVEI